MLSHVLRESLLVPVLVNGWHLNLINLIKCCLKLVFQIFEIGEFSQKVDKSDFVAILAIYTSFIHIARTYHGHTRSFLLFDLILLQNSKRSSSKFIKTSLLFLWRLCLFIRVLPIFHLLLLLLLLLYQILECFGIAFDFFDFFHKILLLNCIVN